MARNANISIDGKSSVDQGDFFPQQSVGSHTSRADLDMAISWWDMVRRANDSHLKPIPRDEDGEPFHLCSSDHYSPRAAFRKDRTRKSGLDHYCRQCRLEQEEKCKATAKNPFS